MEPVGFWSSKNSPYCERWMQVICIILLYVGVKSEVVLLQPGSTFALGDPCYLHIGPLPSSIFIQHPPEAHAVMLNMEAIHPETSKQTFAVWCDNPTYSCYSLL
jgi:hypothetical protein